MPSTDWKETSAPGDEARLEALAEEPHGIPRDRAARRAERRMRAVTVVGAPLLAVGFLVLACGGDDEEAAGPTEDADSGTDGGVASASCRPSDAGTDGKRAPNGCLLFTTGIRSGARVENLPRTDVPNGVSWQNPAAAIEADDQLATITLDDGDQSAELHVSDFGFCIPAGAETWGIVVELKRRSLSDAGLVRTSRVDVKIAGKKTRWKDDDPRTFWPRSAMGTHAYGQEIDTWDVDLYPSDVTPPAFAATLWAAKVMDGGAPGPVTGAVDSLRAAIWYADGDAGNCTR